MNAPLPPAEHLVACPQCDLLQTVPSLAPGEQSRCSRCAALLGRRPSTDIDFALAMTVAALIFLVIANIYPVMSVQVQNFHSHATLIDTVRIMYDEGMALVAAMVLVTALIAPALLLSALLYLLIPLRFGHVAPGFASLFRVLQYSTPWTMIEVLMLGILVALVKLSGMATAVVGIGLWAFAATMILLALVAGSTDGRQLWLLYDKTRRGYGAFV